MLSIGTPFLPSDSAKCIEVVLPVGCVNGCVLNRVAAVDHLPVADIDADMADRTSAVVSPGKEDNVTWLCICGADRGTDIIDALRGTSSHVVDAGIGKYIGNKAAAVKAGGGRTAAPDIRHTKIFFCFMNESRKLRIAESIYISRKFRYDTAARQCAGTNSQIKIGVIVISFIKKFDM